jgi:hypothetical protein
MSTSHSSETAFAQDSAASVPAQVPVRAGCKSLKSLICAECAGVLLWTVPLRTVAS